MSKITYFIYYMSNLLYRLKIPVIPYILMYINRIIFGAYIPPSCTIGMGTRFGYGGCSVVIHDRAVIGKNCIINPSVVVGGRSKKYKVPVIGDNVFIGSGAKILGEVTIGNEVVIAPNSVVINNIPSSCIVVGIPGKIIKQGIKVRDYV